MKPKALAALALLCLIWGYNWVLMKEALQYASPFDFVALRTAPSALLLFAIMAARRQPLRPQAPGALLLLGLLQTTGFIGFVTWALVEGGAGKTAVLAYTMPFWTLLLAWPLLGEKLRGAQWLAVLLALTGLVLVLEPWHLAGSLASKLLAIAGGVSWALAAILAKRLRAKHTLDLLAMTAWQAFFGAIPLLALALLLPSTPVHWTPYFMLILLYNIVLGTALGWMIWLYILHRVSAGTAGLSVLVIPVIGVLASRLQLGERPGVTELTGMFTIGAAMALLSWVNLRRAT